MIRGLALLATLLLSSCAQMAYYSHLARGQIGLLAAREPIESVIRDDSRDARLRERLALIREARQYAVRELRLPDNGSYQDYADLQRPYALWNVLATPEFSLKPVESCFPIAGCVAYRGYYREALAQEQAQRYRAEGYDVDIGGVPAFSTLGWFDDPVLNTMMHWSDVVLVGTLLHELAHQRLYVKDDTAFNESYARFVELEAARRYFSATAQSSESEIKGRERSRQFTRLVLKARKSLASIYAMPLDEQTMRARKQAVFAQLRTEYQTLREEQWNGADPYAAWIAQDLNNATLLPFGLYDEWVPAFSALFEASGHNWEIFHRSCASLASAEKEERHKRMSALMRPFNQSPEHH